MSVLSKLFGHPSFPASRIESLRLANGETIRCKIMQVIWGHEIRGNRVLFRNDAGGEILSVDNGSDQ